MIFATILKWNLAINIKGNYCFFPCPVIIHFSDYIYIAISIFWCTKLQLCFDSMKFFSIDFHRIRHMDGTTKHLYPIASQKSSNCLCKDKQERAAFIPELLGMNIRKNCVSLPCGTNGSFHHFSHIASIRLAMLVCLAYHALLIRYSYATHAQVAHRFQNGMPPACTLQLCTHLVRRESGGIPARISGILIDSTDKGDIGYQFLLKSDIPYCRKTV